MPGRFYMGLGMKAASDNKLKLLKTTLDKWAEIGMIDAETWAAQAVVEVRRDIGRFQSQVSPTL